VLETRRLLDEQSELSVANQKAVLVVNFSSLIDLWRATHLYFVGHLQPAGPRV